MNNQKSYFAKLLLMCILVLIFSIAGLSIFLNTKPSSSVENYPPPGDWVRTSPYPQPVSNTIDPEIFCAQYFMVNEELPPDKKALEEEEYRRCIEARKSPLPTIDPYTRTPSSTKLPVPTAILPRRAAGSGFILDAGFSHYPAMYAVSNQWYTEKDGKITRIFAGAQHGDGAFELPKPWQSLVIIEVQSSDLLTFYPDGGTYLAPRKSGVLRIMDAEGQVLTLLAENGDQFSFNVSTRQFNKTKTGGIYRREAGGGILSEDKTTTIPVSGIDIANQWSIEQNAEHITVLAGKDATGSGVLMVVTTYPDSSIVISEEVYNLPYPVAIFDVQGDAVTLESGNLVFVFDLSSREFIVWPN